MHDSAGQFRQVIEVEGHFLITECLYLGSLGTLYVSDTDMDATERVVWPSVMRGANSSELSERAGSALRDIRKPTIHVSQNCRSARELLLG